jgi:hypothetical protein
VKPNLDAALRQFRRNQGKNNRVIWIDAICINQEDLEERSRQVKLMRRIYTNSSRLVVWLGVADEEARVAASFIAKIYEKNTSGRAEQQSWETHLGGNVGSKLRPWAARLKLSPGFAHTYRALGEFLARAWFRRAWIIQELAAAGDENTIYQCGDAQISSLAMASLFPFRDIFYN